MTVIQLEGRKYEMESGESVLDALLRAGTELPNSCRSGLCQSCLIQVVQGTAPATAQTGLTAPQKALGYVLSCLCRPEADLVLRRVSQEGLTHPAHVLSKDWLSERVLRLRLAVACDFRGGQYITLSNSQGVGRCYSIASLPQDGFIECHIKVYPDGHFSQWLADSISEGAVLTMRGPIGTCFYACTSEQANQPLLLSGIGTGIAPVMGVLKTALAAGHRGNIDVVFAARLASDLYLAEELAAIASAYDRVHLHTLAQVGELSGAARQGDVYQYVREYWPELKGTRVFLCGAQTFVRKMKKQCFMLGASMRDIHADEFVVSGF
jgi:CDP-4-dehydro-6-deoxyglucose reductase